MGDCSQIKKKPTVYLGLSGGVDSAVAASLLLEQGFNVKAFFLKIWSGNGAQCNWVQDRKDALAVAAKLNIPVRTLDFQKAYKEQVFSYFVHEYQAGRTPNPDTLCNEKIKFGVFLEYALKQGADYIATGHHVRRSPQIGNNANLSVHLLTGIDEEKDQSYFLSSLSQYQLRYSLFPIGYLTKRQVRLKAEKLGFDIVANKRSSRGICFIGKVDLKDFLKEYTIENEGCILNQEGQVIGKHDGVAFYTIGQRKGLHIPAMTTDVKPYFVVSKNAKKNELVVSNDENRLFKNSLFCKEPHWIDERKRTFPLTTSARIRYHQPLHRVILSLDAEHSQTTETLLVKFDRPIKAVAPGQVIVFYEGEELIGSAIIS